MPSPLTVRPPFDLEATVRLLQRTPDNRVHRWTADGRFRRAFGAAPEGPLVVEVRQAGRVDAPDLRWDVVAGRASARTRARLARTLRDLLGLDADPGPFLARAEREGGALAATARALRGMRPPRFPSLCETFVNTIPFQQVSLAAGAAMLGRLVERLGQPVDVAGAPCWCFPSPEEVAAASPETLRALGLSRTKAATLVALARAARDDAVAAERLATAPPAEARAELTRFKGVGPWSADLVLLRGCGRMDVFPGGDVGAARGLTALLDGAPDPDPDALVARMGDVRGHLYYCTLGAALLERGLIRGADRPG